MATTLIQAFTKRAVGGNQEASCQRHNQTTQPIVGTKTFHDLMTYISLAAMILSCIISVGLCLGHILNYRQPLIQKQLIRVILTPAIFAIFSFLSVWNYQITDYMYPIPKLYEAFAFLSIFSLSLNLMVPSGRLEDQIEFFSAQTYGKKQMNGYSLLRLWYIQITQFLPVTLICTILGEALLGAKCLEDKTYKAVDTIVAIVGTITGILAIVGLFSILKNLHRDIRKRDPTIVGKLACFKFIVIVQCLQSLILSILSRKNVLKGNDTISYNDLNLGLKPFLTSLEAMLVCFVMIYFYHPRHHGRSSDFVGKENADAQEEGMSGRKVVNPKISAFRALFDTVNMLDVIQGVGRAFHLVGKKPTGRGVFQ